MAGDAIGFMAARAVVPAFLWRLRLDMKGLCQGMNRGVRA